MGQFSPQAWATFIPAVAHIKTSALPWGRCFPPLGGGGGGVGGREGACLGSASCWPPVPMLGPLALNPQAAACGVGGACVRRSEPAVEN